VRSGVIVRSEPLFAVTRVLLTVLLHVFVQILSKPLGVVEQFESGKVDLVVQSGSLFLAFLQDRR
jgi:hypothetical protein